MNCYIFFSNNDGEKVTKQASRYLEVFYAGKFDLSEMRMHLQQYVNEITDVLTTPEEIQNYSNFCDALFRINSITNFYYTPRPDGSLPEMDQRAKMKLRESYQRAMREAAPLLTDEDTGEVGTEMRRIARELSPLLQADADALDQVDVSKTPMHLPEIIGKGRELAVDLQNNDAPTVSGASNTRQYIRVQGANGSETGYFTPTVEANPTKDYQALLDRLQEKYPAYRTVIDNLRTKDPSELAPMVTLNANPFVDLKGQTVQQKNNELTAFWYTDLYQPLGFNGAQIQPLARRNDFGRFSEELFSGLKPVRESYNNYIRGNGFLKVEEGANLDRRNISNLFRMIKMDIAEKNATYAADREKLPADQRKPYTPKNLKTAKCVKTEGFGEQALKAKEFAALKAQAEADFLADMKKQVKETPASAIQNERDFLATMAQSVGSLNGKLGKANPFFHSTSRTYKKLVSAGSDLQKLTAKLQKKLKNPGDVLSAKDSAKLIKAGNKLKDCAAAYQAKKDTEKERGRVLDDVEKARVTASGDVNTTVSKLLDNYQDTLSQQIAKDHPMNMVQYRMKQAQGGLSGLTGQKLQKKVAEILYYKSLTKIDLGTKKSQELKNAVIPKEIRKQRDRLMELPAFKKLSKMPEEELRSLASRKGADKLLDRFVNEVAKDLQPRKKAEGPNPEPPQNGGPEIRM